MEFFLLEKRGRNGFTCTHLYIYIRIYVRGLLCFCYNWGSFEFRVLRLWEAFIKFSSWDSSVSGYRVWFSILNKGILGDFDMPHFVLSWESLKMKALKELTVSWGNRHESYKSYHNTSKVLRNMYKLIVNESTEEVILALGFEGRMRV